MSGGYYNLLGITREAEAEDVAKAYRKMALKHHPDLNKDSGVDTRTSFAQVSEAYEVLSNARYRALYDGFGEDGLTSGADAYSFSGDADGIFKAFFGVANPFQVMGNNADATKHLFFSESAVAAKAAQQKPREISLTCTLEEVYSGASHDVPYTAAMVDREGKMYKEVAATIQVDIERGLPDGSRLKYSGKGGRDSASTGEVIATVNLAKHPHFVWDDSDLIFTHKITLEQALVGFSVEVMTLGVLRRVLCASLYSCFSQITAS